MNSRTLLRCFLVSLAVGVCTGQVHPADSQSDRPNIVLINCDDLGYGDVGCYGATKQRTPNIDRLANEGIRFTSFYSTSGVCTPSRTSLMTGCYPRRLNMHTNGVGYWVLFPGNERGLNPDESTIAEVLGPAGYATMCIGKWHLGDQPPFLPTRQGFDHYFGIPFSNDMGQTRAGGQRDPARPATPLLRDDTVIEEEPDQHDLTRRYTDEALRFITDSRSRPFFLYLAHTFPHWPHYASKDFAGKSSNGVYGDCIEEVDWSTGQILAKLTELGLENRTLVLFTSDNGGVRSHGSSNDPLKGGKATSFEGGHRVPCLVRAPGRVPAGVVCDRVWTMLDVLPTFAALAGAKPPTDRIIDGFDETALLAKPGSTASPYDKAGYFYYYEGHLQAVRRGPWKLRVAKDGPKLGSTPLPTPELFNLDADIGETTDVAAQHPAVADQLLKLIDRCREDIGDGDKDGKNQRPAGRSPGAKPLSAAAREPQHPNILVILADDLGYGDVGCYNAESKVLTPNLDRLAREGMRFTDAHSPATVCTPSRYSLLTGQMAFRVRNGGTVFTGVGGPSLIAPGRLTLPGMLRDNGYATACVGKWHVGMTFHDRQGQPVRGEGLDAVRQADFSRRIDGGPIDHGFQSFFGTACCPTTDWLYAFIENDRVPVPPAAVIDKQQLPKHAYSDDCRPGLLAADFPMQEVDLVFLQKSIAFLEQNIRQSPQKPFFLFHATQAVHLPSFPAPQFQGRTQAGPHGDFIYEFDWIVGQLMDKLEELGVADNTLVVVTSDNGPEVTSVVHMRSDHGHDPARPWRGMKRDAWEGGHRVPLIVRWPGQSKQPGTPAGSRNTGATAEPAARAAVIPGSICSQLVSLTDVFATAAEIIGVTVPDEAAEDSFSMLPALRGVTDAPIRPYLLQQSFGGARTLSIRRGEWKYIDHPGSGGNRYETDAALTPYRLPDTVPDAPAQLYDLSTDPGETHNLIEQQPEIAAELKVLLEDSKSTGRTRPRLTQTNNGIQESR